MKLDGLPSTVVPPPAVTLTFDILIRHSCRRTYILPGILLLLLSFVSSSNLWARWTELNHIRPRGRFQRGGRCPCHQSDLVIVHGILSSCSLLLSLSPTGCDASGWSPTEWLTACKNRWVCKPLSSPDRHALIRVSFLMFDSYFGRRRAYIQIMSDSCDDIHVLFYIRF